MKFSLQQDEGIFEQTWPITDHDHKLPMAVKVRYFFNYS